jgi:hypothetical protein
MKKHRNDEIIKTITEIRSRNNVYWMLLLRLAFEASPKKAKSIMAMITRNDKEVSKWTSKLR